MKKTVIISFPKFLSGLTQYSFLLFKAIQKEIKNKNVFFICNRIGSENYDIDTYGVKTFIEKTRFLPISILKLVCFVYYEKIQIVHFQSFFKYPFLTYILVKIFKLTNKVLFFTVHDILPHNQRAWDRFFISKIYNAVDCVIVHSNANKHELKKLLGRKKINCRVIPHPMYDNLLADQRISKSLAKKILGIQNITKILLFFGHIEPRKGIAVLLKELPKLLKKEKNIHLLIVGRDHFPEGVIDHLISKYAIEKNVSIVNKFIADSEVTLYFSAADAVVLPYLKGSTSGVLKIAFAHKIPAIATKVGELPEMIKSFQAGILIDLPLGFHDVDAIVSLLKENEATHMYSNYSELVDYFSWESAAKQTIDLYNGN